MNAYKRWYLKPRGLPRQLHTLMSKSVANQHWTNDPCNRTSWESISNPRINLRNLKAIENQPISNLRILILKTPILQLRFKFRISQCFVQSSLWSKLSRKSRLLTIQRRSASLKFTPVPTPAPIINIWVLGDHVWTPKWTIDLIKSPIRILKNT
jgi:hypothetical protein